MLLSFFVVGAACGSERSDPSAATGPGSSAAATPPASPPEEPPASCPDGLAIDPPADELEPEEGASKTIAARLNRLRGLMKRYPTSAKIRVAAASLSLGPPPAGNPVIAQKLLEEAIGLHERGCRLPEALEWEAQENLGLAFMLQANHEKAAGTFQKIAVRWPAVPQTHFDHACALCRLDRVDDCLDAFMNTLAAAESEDRPDFVNHELNPYHFVHQARQSTDLAKLRSDPRFEKTIAPHLKRR